MLYGAAAGDGSAGRLEADEITALESGGSMSEDPNIATKGLPTRGQLNVPHLKESYKGPFEVDGAGGYFPGLQFSPQLVPQPRMVVPFEYSKPHFIETVSIALRNECPLVAYFVFDEKGEKLPDHRCFFGCVGYPLQYEFTPEGKLRLLLEFGTPVRVLSQKIQGEVCFVGVTPVAQKSEREPAVDIADTDQLTADARLLLEARGEAKKVAAIDALKSGSPFFRVVQTTYALAGFFEFPFSLKLAILSTADMSKRIELVREGLATLGPARTSGH